MYNDIEKQFATDLRSWIRNFTKKSSTSILSLLKSPQKRGCNSRDWIQSELPWIQSELLLRPHNYSVTFKRLTWTTNCLEWVWRTQLRASIFLHQLVEVNSRFYRIVTFDCCLEINTINLHVLCSKTWAWCRDINLRCLIGCYISMINSAWHFKFTSP